MGFSWKFTVGAASILFVSGCVAYPYETAFDACDSQAGACYRYCEQFADIPEDFAACHADCEAQANACFAAAYDDYRYAQSSYGYSGGYSSWPWYGRYGHWYPDRGFFFSYGYAGGYGYNRPHYYRRRRHNDHNAYRGGYRDRDYDQSGDAPQPPQDGAATPPPPSYSPSPQDSGGTPSPKPRKNTPVTPRKNQQDGLKEHER